MSDDWLAQVQRGIEAEQYHAVEEEAPEAALRAAAYRVANAAHQFDGRVDGKGLSLTGRADRNTGKPMWEWGLALRGWGRPGALEVEAEGGLTADGGRIDLQRGPRLTEWFDNRAEGLEHGFTVAQPPDDLAEEGLLVFDLALSGGLGPVFSEDGQAIDFHDGGSVSVLRYAKLVVTDATGETLVAWMEPIAGGVRIAVEDADAIYPVTVDPLATSPAWMGSGDQNFAEFGNSVATAGDVNGDGYADVIVGAWVHDASGALGATDRGRAYIYLGSASGLATSPAWAGSGDENSAFFGLSVATAGDVNGDGYADVVVGAYGHDAGAGANANRGRAYVYLGSASGLATSPAWTVSGDENNARFGYSVATAGDVNGDGYADVVVGAYQHDAGAGFNVERGRAYVYLGSASGLANSPAWTVSGDEDFANFGYSVATAGDVNGDGYADVVVGAHFHDAGAGFAANRGRAYVYLGSASGLATSPAWTGSGDENNALFGNSVATAGDVNGDGYADVVVGAYSHAVVVGAGSNRGRAYVYLGSASGLATSPAWTGSGDEDLAYFGYSVATAGDVNGDGYADVVVGAYQHDAGAGFEANRGRAYFYLGSASGLATSPAWTGSGDEDFASFGNSVATAGDVNGDGYADVVVGAPGHDAGAGSGASRGRAYVYIGSASGLATISVWTGSGDENFARFGQSLATAGDVNGDGYADVVVGAYAHDAGAGVNADRGRAYVYLGSASGLTTSPAWTGSGDENGANFGISVATAGDVNGDGYADIVVGAEAHDAGAGSGANRGRAYVYLGSALGLATSPAWTGSGDETFAHFGFSVATAGDVNGDGYADVVVGAYVHDAGAGVNANRGRAYVYLGSASGLTTSPAWTGSGDENSALFGYSVATAGDVNGDGYADVVVGAYQHDADRGRAYVYLGSASGLTTSPAWTGSGDENLALFGVSVATAGDVNGDGYADVVVGAYAHDAGAGAFADRGRAYAYLGSASGLATTAAWTASGDENSALFGVSVATSGDVNGDGYADVVVGAYAHDAGAGVNADRGRAYVYLGSASGLTASPAWTGSGDENGANFGISVATAGDVNGDGYADVVVGAYLHDAGAGINATRGRAYVYSGGGGQGVSVKPQQRRADDAGAISQLGASDKPDSFRIAGLGRSPFGRGRVRLQVEVKPLGALFDGFGTDIGTQWIDSETEGAALSQFVGGLVLDTVYHWRARLHYDPVTTPFAQHSRWFTIPRNGWEEADLRTVAPGSGRVSSEQLLTVALGPSGSIKLTWGASCLPTDTDYEVYEGILGTFTSHIPRFCSTRGATTLTFIPASGSTYYLVVPSNELREGSYGVSSEGGERPPAVPACRPQKIVATCP